MIRETNATRFIDETGAAKIIATLYGSSTDTKPTENFVNGSAFVEVDTGKFFLFDEGAGDWVEVQ